eukprot:COSAG01_NODE_32059_length_587_cov_0.717213_1_plen_45_part_10
MQVGPSGGLGNAMRTAGNAVNAANKMGRSGRSVKNDSLPPVGRPG